MYKWRGYRIFFLNVKVLLKVIGRKRPLEFEQRSMVRILHLFNWALTINHDDMFKYMELELPQRTLFEAKTGKGLNL